MKYYRDLNSKPSSFAAVLQYTGIVLILLFSVLGTTSYAQKKYYIFFKDKGVSQNESLNKSDLLYQQTLQSLSLRCIERRTKTLGSENIITYEDLPIYSKYIEELKTLGVKIENELRWFNSVTAFLTEAQINDILKKSFVSRIEPVRILRYKRENTEYLDNYKTAVLENDQINYGTSFTQLNLSDIPKIHSLGIRGNGIVIGVLDAGFRWKLHESLENTNVLSEYDFIFKDSITSNENQDNSSQDSHGTSVLSVLAGFKDSVLIGAAFNSSFILAKTEDIRSETTVEEDNYAAALIWMESMGIDIATSSLSYNQFDNPNDSYTYSDMNGKTAVVTKAAEHAFMKGVLMFSSAGNEGNSPWYYISAPADGINTIAVGAVNSNKVLAGFSSHGPTADGRIKPELVAQGVGVFCASTSKYNSYTYSNGTSLSTPIAAGVAALLLSAYPYLKNTQARSILLETASNSASPNNDIGFGLISAVNAISFPNFETKDDVYTLHKLFLTDSSIDETSVKLFFSVDGSNYSELSMRAEGNGKFKTEFPQFNSSYLVNFYFSYTDSAGNTVRDPEGFSSYKFNYGDLNIYKNLTVPILSDYDILSQNYPNPFNNKTTIKFRAASTGLAEINVFDILGQKVKTLFKGNAKVGENVVQWDGTNDSGISTASGVFVYVLRIDGKEYGKKMMLIK